MDEAHVPLPIRCATTRPDPGYPVFAVPLHASPAEAALDPAGVAPGRRQSTLIAGTFQGTLGSGESALASAGLTDAFWAQLDACGGVKRMLQFGDAGPQAVTAFVTDHAGNSYIAGDFEGTLRFGRHDVLTAADDFTSVNDVFVAKLDRRGRTRWAKHVSLDAVEGGILGADALAVDAAGNVFVVGHLEGTASLDGHTWSSGALSNFVVKLDRSGAFQWAARFRGPDQEVTDAEVDAEGNVYVLAQDGRGSAVYLFKWSGTGEALAEARFGSSGDQLAVAPDFAVVGDRVYVIGRDAFDLPAENSVFLATLDTSFNVVRMEAFGDRLLYSLAASPNGGLYMAGERLAGNPSGTVLIPFVESRAPGTLDFEWHRSFQGSATITELASSHRGDALLAGEFDGSLDLGSGPIDSVDGPDLFVSKLRH